MSELRRRNVIRMAVLYVVAAWLVMQVTEVVLSLADLPEWIGPATLALLAVGFPIALVFSWFYELTPEGISLERDSDPAESIARTTGRHIDVVIISLLSAAVLLFAWHSWWPSAPMDKTIAVMAFENLSGDADNDYFSDGLSEELISLLTSDTDLRVVGRSSSFAFKGKRVDLRNIGEQLGVANILEGSVRKSGDRVRITAQLTSSDNGYQLWSRSYDRTLDDIFAVQEDIASNIVNALHGALGEGTAKSRIGDAAPTRDTDAYQLYLRGRFHFHQRGASNLRKSISLFEQAIALDPNFAEAHVGKAAAVFVLPGYSLDSYESLIGIASEHAEKALAIDETLSEAEAVLGAVSGMQLEWISARRHFERAIQGSSGNSFVHHWYGVHLLATAQLESARVTLLDAYKLDPMSAVITAWLAAMETARGDYESATRYRRLAVDGGYRLGYFRLFETAYTSGDLQDAERSLAAYFQSYDIGDASEASLIVNGFRSEDRRATAIDAVSRLQSSFTIPWHTVELFALLGSMEEAFRMAEFAVDNNDMIATWGIWSPLMSEFRRDARFPALVERMRLPEYWNEFGWPPMCWPDAETLQCE